MIPPKIVHLYGLCAINLEPERQRATRGEATRQNDRYPPVTLTLKGLEYVLGAGVWTSARRQRATMKKADKRDR